MVGLSPHFFTRKINCL